MKKYNLLIPMVGRGQRFRDEGFTLPKQLIEVGHQQMIDWSMSCIKTDECNKIFVIRRDTVENNQMDEIQWKDYHLYIHIKEKNQQHCLL